MVFHHQPICLAILLIIYFSAPSRPQDLSLDVISIFSFSEQFVN